MQVTFRIQYHTRWGESLCLVADDRKYPMQWGEGDVWSVRLPHCSAAELADYSYVVMEGGIIRRTEWRHHSRKAAGARKVVAEDSWIDCPIDGCPFPREHQNPLFDRAGFRGAGVAVPVFSLRSSGDFGIGEFADLRPLIDWAASVGMCIIQLLPVNDTTRKGGWDDSYPYSPVSSFALHPLYMHLQDIGIREDAAFRRQQNELNALPELDYPRVYKAKMALIRKAFLTRGARDLASAAFKRFYRDNIAWLGEYAEFCAMRDGLETEYYAWMQYHLDRQFREVAEYARSKGISLKGDLPIGVSRDSADACWHPELFNLDSNAGAPPDFFSADGQNWGFPTYNWDEMAVDDYAWWKARLRHMARYFDAFRIDHILGWFRIWEIPAVYMGGIKGHFNPAIPYGPDEISRLGLPLDGLFHEDPRHPGMYQPLISPDRSTLQGWQQEVFDRLYNDFFYHRHDTFWKENAERKLPELLGATGMLACGEDLGMVPDCVHGVMEHEKVLTLEMQMMDKGRPWPALSVCASSSHDMSTLRMQFADSHEGRDPETWEVRRILWDHLDSASMLAIFPLQDWLALDAGIRRPGFRDERINEPSDPHHHWRWRMHLEAEALGVAHELNMQVEALVKDSRRWQYQLEGR